MVFQHHPDKKGGSKNMFQKVREAYSILSNESKRIIYDRTGNLCELSSHQLNSFIEAYQYYRSRTKEVTKADIDSYKKKYQNSADEEKDLIKFYQELFK